MNYMKRFAGLVCAVAAVVFFASCSKDKESGTIAFDSPAVFLNAGDAVTVGFSASNIESFSITGKPTGWSDPVIDAANRTITVVSPEKFDDDNDAVKSGSVTLTGKVHGGSTASATLFVGVVDTEDLSGKPANSYLINKKETNYLIDAMYKGDLTEPVTLTTALRFYTRSGSEVKFAYTTLDEESVDVTLQVYKVATLPVEVSFINAPRDFDSSVLAYTLSKKTLNVAGPESQIDRLSALSVGTIDLSTFAPDKVYEMPIELPTGIHLLDNLSSITISFDSSKLETKTLNLPSSCVQVVNLPSSYQLTVETERLMNVTLCGPAGSLETLTPEQVVIEIDADDFSVAIGQQNIACRLYVPANSKIFALGSYMVQCKIESNQGQD